MNIKWVLRSLIFSVLFVFTLKATEDIVIPSLSTVTLTPHYSVKDIMRSTLQKYEKNFDPTQIEIKKGGMSADQVMVSRNFVARLSRTKDHRIEALDLYNLIQKMRISSIPFDRIRFNLCLPISIQLIAKDRTECLQNNTSASLFVMPKAQGFPIYKFIEIAKTDVILGNLFMELGKTLAKFQMNFMENINGRYYTAAHGDFHGNNIFCLPRIVNNSNDSQWSFSLIDCGGMELRGMHPLMDPLYFIYRSAHYLKRGYKDKEIKYITQEFYKGYLGGLSRPVLQSLQTISPIGRFVAEHELARIKKLLFINPDLEVTKNFLPYFDKINKKVVNKVLKNLSQTNLVLTSKL